MVGATNVSKVSTQPYLQVASGVTAFDIGSMLSRYKREKVTRCEGLKAKSKQFVCLNWYKSDSSCSEILWWCELVQ